MTADKKIESWKEIAAHFKRSERTVKRWEALGLPVHRTPSGGIYAYERDLDNWLAGANRPGSTSSQADPQPQPLAPPPQPLSEDRRGYLWLLGLGAAAAALVTVALVSNLGSEGTRRRLHSERLWEGPGTNRLGDVSRDGRTLCYTSPETEGLMTLDFASRSARSIVDNRTGPKAGGIRSCTFSPDGRHIAFSRDAGKTLEIWVSDADGRNDRFLWAESALVDLAVTDWSPDSKLLAITGSSGGVRLLDALTGRVVASVDGPRDRRPARARFSPNGQWIAFDLDRDEFRGGAIWIASTSSRDVPPAELVAGSGVARLVDWSGDQSVVYLSDRNGREQASALTLDSRMRLTRDEMIATTIGPRPLRLTSRGELYHGLGSGRRDIAVASLDIENEKVEPLESTAAPEWRGHNFLPDWSPGGRLSFVPFEFEAIGRGAPGQIFLRSDHRQAAEVRLPLREITAVRWTSDGSGLLATGVTDDSRTGVFRADLKSGTASALRISPDPGRSYHDAAESRATKTIFYKIRERMREPSPLVAMQPMSPGPDPVFLPSVYSYSLSADGTRMAYSTFDDANESIRLVDLRTRGVKELHTERRNGRIISVALTPDSKHVLYAQRGSLYTLPVSGGPPKRLPHHAQAMREIRIHPDGRRIAYTYGEHDQGEVWVTRGFMK